MRQKNMSFKKRFQHQPIFREKFLYTIWICCSFVMLGLLEALFGPTFPDLRLIIHERLSVASWLFTSSSTGILVGAIFSGFLYDRFNRLLIIIGSTIGMTVIQIAIPFCSTFWLMLIVKFLSGITFATLDTGGNAEVVSMWGSESDSYMQAVHFCFSLGGFIAPLIAQPFLAELTNDSNLSDSYNGSDNSTLTSVMYQSTVSTIDSHCGDSKTNDDTDKLYGDTDVKYAYLISAILTFATVIPYCCMYYLKRDSRIRTDESTIDEKDSTNFSSRPLAVKVFLIMLLSCLMCLYVGTEDTYAGFLMTFVTSGLCWSKSEGSFATSVFWLCFGITRLLCIPLIRCVKTEILMLLFSIGVAISFAGLLFAVQYQLTSLIWVFFGAPGVFMSIIFAAMFTWTNDNVLKVTGKVSSLMMTSSSVGIMTFPVLFGYTLDHFTPMWFIYLLLSFSILWVVIYVVYILSTKCLLTKERLAIEMSVHNGKTEVVNGRSEVTYM